MGRCVSSVSASSVLVLIGAAMFFALGLEPAVSGLVNRKLPRWAAVSLVVVVVFGVLAGCGGGRDSPACAGSAPIHRTGSALCAAGSEPLDGDRQTQRTLPCATTDHRHDSRLGRTGGRRPCQGRRVGVRGGVTLRDRRLRHDRLLPGRYAPYPGDDLPVCPELAPTRARFSSATRCMAKVGDYVFGNVLTSLIAGAATFVWCFIFHVPYALLLGRFRRDRGSFPLRFIRRRVGGRAGGA